MKMYERIKFERKRLNLTQAELKEEIFKKTGYDIGIKTIRGWESSDSQNRLPRRIIELQCLCEVLEISPSDLINGAPRQHQEAPERLLKAGKQLYNKTGMENYRDLISKYYVVNKSEVDRVPRYDIELRQIYSALRVEKQDRIPSNIGTLFEYVQYYRGLGKVEENMTIIEEDHVGSRGLYDYRVPFVARELILCAEWLSSELSWLGSEILEWDGPMQEIHEKLGGNVFVKSCKY